MSGDPPLGNQRPSATMLFQSIARVGRPAGDSASFSPAWARTGRRVSSRCARQGAMPWPRTRARPSSTACRQQRPAWAASMLSLPLDLIAPRILQIGARGRRMSAAPVAQTAGHPPGRGFGDSGAAAAPYAGDERLSRLVALHRGSRPRQPERKAARSRHRRLPSARHERRRADAADAAQRAHPGASR